MARDRVSGAGNYSPTLRGVRVEIFRILIVFVVKIVLTDQSEVDSNSSRDDVCADMAVQCGSSVDMIYTSSKVFSVCGSGCCTEEVEKNLQMRSQQEFASMLTNFTNSSVDIFNSSRMKFDDFFTRMLDQSSVTLHNMFVKTYGLLYQQNSDIFMDLFHNLRRYFKGLGTVDLSVALDEFFSVLMQRIFILLNAQHDFDDTYLNCISDNVDRIKPFGDVPATLLRQVKRSFTAAKTFVQGMAVGCNVVDAISKMRMTDSCNQEVTRMLHCSECSGFPCAKPCQSYCLIITSKCLELLHNDLSETWISFIDELVKVAEKLEGPFNIENVVDPIEVKISEAIMNFQANFDTLSTQIFTKCGEPQLTANMRRRRSLNATKITSDDKRSQKKQKNKSKDLKRLDHLVQDIRSLLQKTRFFWKSLVNLTCDDILGTSDSSTSCWNGTHLVSIAAVQSLNVVGLRLTDLDFSSTTVVDQQIQHLRAITVKLKMAVSGMDANWIDSGSDGSGSGSGYSEDKDTEEDDAKEDEEDDSQSLLFDEESRHHGLKSQMTTEVFRIYVSSSHHNHPFFAYVGCWPTTYSAILMLVVLPGWHAAYMHLTGD